MHGKGIINFVVGNLKYDIPPTKETNTDYISVCD